MRGLNHSCKNIGLRIAFLALILHAGGLLYGQYGFSFDIQKPKEFENRVLGSEKPQKKFSVPRRFLQNTVTHYNYFFNANQKLNAILQRAKDQFREDYTKLLPFYNYTLDATTADSVELDSVAFKAQTGIVLHDLRNDWVDNMYLLWGISYYLQQQHDSAYLMFQFINYAFAAKEKDGYYLTIGSKRDGNSANSISTKEKNGLLRRAMSEPPSRNDAFIWQVRNYIQTNRLAEASSLILALRNDTLFPARLQNDLAEVQALYYYRQSNWDSAAAYLEKALSNAGNLQERARWEYLLGQLYERGNQLDASTNFYEKAIGHTTDPIMDVYARLALVRVNKDEKENTIENNIATLLKMARRDKYYDYRDIIYFMAGQMELERNNTDGALQWLEKSTKYAANNPEQRNRAFLQLADLTFQKRLYRESLRYHDSLQLNDPSLPDPTAIANRKSTLTNVVAQLDILHRQDSLQTLARMDEGDRRDIIRKAVRRLRREMGLKEEGSSTGRVRNEKEEAPSLFADNGRGEWYFYSSSLRQKGQADFKSRWGNRPNTDNWRRSAAQSGASANPSNPGKTGGTDVPAANPEDAISYDALLDKIPTTEEKMKRSQDSVMNALFNLGITLVQDLEDCQGGTDTLVSLQNQFPEFAQMDQVLFNIYYCYQRSGEKTRAAAVRQLMAEKYSHSNYTAIVTTGKDPQGKSRRDEATRTYENIYDQFIEGRFEEAVRNKRRADSTYGSNYWTPQLLYIEAVYHIKQRNDSTAKQVLQNIINQFSGQPLAEKATTMLDVLNRRAEIEEELRNLVIEMPAEDSSRHVATAPVTVAPPVVINDKPVEAPPITDTVTQQPVVVIEEPKIQKPSVTAVGDSSSVRTLRDTALATRAPGADISKPVVRSEAASYLYETTVPHYVVLALNKIDPIFVSEARNAFYRYNRNEYFNKQMQAELVELDAENRLLLISPFATAEEALAYVDKTRPKTASEILPWLKGGKYSYLIISARNLELLKARKDVQAYRDFLDQNLPGRF